MIIFYEGVPGSGKTYDATVKIVANLKMGRTVYTNIDGIEDVRCKEMIKCLTGLDDFDIDKKLIVLTREQVFHFWDFVIPGSFIVIDEVQKYFNSRDWQKEENRKCADWCSTHRHEGFDALFLTQKIEKVDTQVRTLTEWTYRYKKINFLGSLINQSYICFAFSGDDTSNPLTKIVRRYEKKYFACYKSYISKDVKELKIQTHANILKHPLFFFIPVVLCFCVYFTYHSIKNHAGAFHKIKSSISSTKEAAAATTPPLPPELQGMKPKIIIFTDKLKKQQNEMKKNHEVISNKKAVKQQINIRHDNKKSNESYAIINGKKIYYCDEGICEK